MKDEVNGSQSGLLSSFILHPSSLDLARVAQLTERWSYKPEVEGLNPSLGTSTRGRSRWQEQTRLHTPAASCLLFLGA